MLICDCDAVNLLFCVAVCAKWGSDPVFYLPLPLDAHARSSTSNSGFAPLLRSIHISYVEYVRAVFWHRPELHFEWRALLFLDK